MKTDEEIRRDVEAELRWDPDLDATDIAVAVKNGVVTLTGFVKSYTHKYEAEMDTKRVAGVSGVANEIEVRLPDVDRRPDPEIARDAVAALKSALPFSWERIKVIVRSGWITLEGDVDWNFQREAAEKTVRNVKGALGVINSLVLKPAIKPGEVRKQIEDAFRRSALVDASRVRVETVGSEVVLSGTVRSWAEREEAERAAWAAPGVTKVDNRITVKL
jgi:osmotically-inducible protein OsmY